jgi:cellulose biosynthesis protein BcsQ
MVKKIALFNHKGGVSKTTTTFHLGWMLASKGKRVILVDADPQSNLTGLILGSERFEKLYEEDKERNIKAALAPAFESRPIPIQAVDCVAVPQREGLFLLPGHLELSEYEVMLGIAQSLSGSFQSLQSLPGALSYLLNVTAEKYQADYMLIDMESSLSSINQNILMSSDFFIIPTMADYFSLLAIRSLSNVLPRWYAWSMRAQKLEVLQNAAYPFPRVIPKFLGTIIQGFRIREDGEATASFQTWLGQVKEAVSATLVPSLQKNYMTLPKQAYPADVIKESYCLAKIPKFTDLIATAQKFNKPVFELSELQFGEIAGAETLTQIKNRDKFKKDFSLLTDKVLRLTNYAVGD